MFPKAVRPWHTSSGAESVPLDFSTRKNLALVVYLAVAGAPQSRESLITLLWPGLEPSRARAGLRCNLSTLRKKLGGVWLQVDRETVALDPDVDVFFDVNRFRALAASGLSHDHPPDQLCPD